MSRRITMFGKRKLFDKALVNFLLWIAISAILTGIFFGIDTIDGTSRDMFEDIVWAPGLSLFVTIVIFNLLSADILRRYIKHHGRNVVSWITAIIVFSPFLAGIAYLLTWPNGQQLRSGKGDRVT